MLKRIEKYLEVLLVLLKRWDFSSCKSRGYSSVLGERLSGTQKVAGSIPAFPIAKEFA